MSDFQAIADRAEIEALRGEAADAVMMRDYDRAASLFTPDAVVRIPHIHAEVIGREEIRAGAERLQGLLDYFVQTTHPGTIVLNGDTASGRAYIQELIRFRGGRSELNYAVYHDRYQRTSDGWNRQPRSPTRCPRLGWSGQLRSRPAAPPDPAPNTAEPVVGPHIPAGCIVGLLKPPGPSPKAAWRSASSNAENAMTTNESEIREFLERRIDAMQSKDIDRLLSFYSPDIVYYDAVPPLRFVGTEEIRRNFLRWFDGYKGLISLETHDLTIATSEDTAFARMLHLDSGDRKGLAGPVVSMWVRETVCLRRSEDRWLITHEHVSIPFDPITFAKTYVRGLPKHVGRQAKKLIWPARSAQPGR